MARSASLGFSCLVMSGCKYRYMETRRRCVAEDHEPTKNPTREISEDGSFLRFYDFTNLWFYDFRFWASNFTHSKQDKSMWRPDGQVGLIGFLLGLSRLAVSIDTWRRANAASRRTAHRRKPDPRKFRIREVLRFYDFMNLWFYDFRFRSSNITRSEQDKSMWRPDGQVGLVEYFRGMSGCKYPYVAAPRMCRAWQRTDEKTDPWNFRRWEVLRFYDFMILWLSLLSE